MVTNGVPRLGVVIPTTGERPQFLKRCIESIRDAGSAHISVVCPEHRIESLLMFGPLVDQWVCESSTGAALAINQGIAELPDHLEFVAWLGDDDLLERDSISSILSRFTDQTSFVFGKCRYVDHFENTIFVNQSGAFATKLFRFGPNLAPQPGCVIRRSHWNAVGGLNPNLKWTFDLDLFLRLRSVGDARYIDRVVSSFRWHEGSLTAGQRRGSVKEASEVRRAHLPRTIKPLSFFWEPLVRFAIYYAGSIVTLRARRALGRS